MAVNSGGQVEIWKMRKTVRDLLMELLEIQIKTPVLQQKTFRLWSGGALFYCTDTPAQP